MPILAQIKRNSAKYGIFAIFGAIEKGLRKLDLQLLDLSVKGPKGDA